MIHIKNVINLGVIGSDTVLPSGQKCMYYIYVKSDGDLYMYDSERDIETNLFTLEFPAKGLIEVETNLQCKGTLNMFAFNTPSTKLEITALVTRLGSLSITAYVNEIDDPIPSPLQDIIVSVRVLGTPQDGTLDITAYEGLTGELDITAFETISVGTIDVYVKI